MWGNKPLFWAEGWTRSKRRLELGSRRSVLDSIAKVYLPDIHPTYIKSSWRVVWLLSPGGHARCWCVLLSLVWHRGILQEVASSTSKMIAISHAGSLGLRTLCVRGVFAMLSFKRAETLVVDRHLEVEGKISITEAEVQPGFPLSLLQKTGWSRQTQSWFHWHCLEHCHQSVLKLQYVGC